MRHRILALAFLATALSAPASFTYAESTKDQLNALRSLQPQDDAAQKKAAALTKSLAKTPELALVDVLKAMQGASPIGKNWLLSLANVVHRNPNAAKASDLESFLKDTSQDPEARYTVFRWITEGNDELRSQLLDAMINDPSLELRFDAVAHHLAKPDASEANRLKVLLDAARHPTQIVEIIEKLKAQNVVVDQAKHMGFVSQWKLIGPFDNVGSDKFDVVYDVESDWLRGSVKPSYAGKSGNVEWIEHSTDNAEGQVDVAKLFNNEKGCVVYAETTVQVPSDLACEIRVGCINAQKVWVNGTLAIANEVYHTGMQIDQYAAPIRLKAGPNRILVKVCQNEQKEAWAQLFTYQVRLCDESGKAITFQ